MKKFKVGIQLFSLRYDMKEDMDATLAKVKEAGYDYVEFAGYFGKSAEEVKALLDKHGLTCISVHQTHDVFLGEEAQANVDFLKTIGAKYCCIPWMPVQKMATKDGFAQLCEEAKKVGKLLKDNGIQLGYHNHDFEFLELEGEFIFDKLYSTVPQDLLTTEIDTCWVKYAGQDPAEYIRKYTGRVSIVHLKDFTCKSLNAGPAYSLIDENGKEVKGVSREENEFMFKALGTGMQDFKAILEACEASGTEYIIYEQDQAPERPAIESAKLSREFLKSLGQ